MLWLTMGLGVLMQCGLNETIAFLGLESEGEVEGDEAAVYVAICLTMLVLTWPLVLLEMVRGNQR